ncbi:MAG: aminomethyltransferase family protein [Myxococcota bacterium]
MTDLLKSPFHELYEQHYPSLEWEEWGGYGSATLMGDADEEIKTIRTGTVIFDMSPVVKYSIKGSDAETFLNKLTTRQMAIKPGRVRYTCWCNVDGKLLDDGTAFRVAADEYLLCPGDRHAEHFASVAKNMDVEVKDVTGEIASLTIQGKTSLSTLQKVGIRDLEVLTPYSFQTYDSPAGPIRISRTGFFGDLGYELWMQCDQAGVIWNRLIEAGGRPIGMATLCNARVEAGMIIPGEGYDFEPASPDGRSPHPLNRSPLEMDLAFLISSKKDDFIGRDALLAEKESGSTWAYVGLELDGKQASSHGDKVFCDDEEVGIVTSGLYSVSLERNIALASVKAEHRAMGTHFEVKTEGGKVSAVSVKKPFISPERRNQTPAPAL